MPMACLSLYAPSSTITKLSTPNSKSLLFNRRVNEPSNKLIPCNARASCGSSSITDLDLYDLLGIHNASDQSQIKNAYRALQKRCHPDIAGPTGHDMAIILNDAYAVLSDPSSRLAYDKEQAKTAELRGYTGKPIYSVWFGPESEERAVFVDEVKCVGCLKCALFAQKTFAIESVYGRARVVAQWADPEHKIFEAIGSCPVDCISIVERSNLAALEFLMSKQPRGNVRVGVGNTAGERVSNILADVKKFQIKYEDKKEKVSSRYSKETDRQRSARVSAIQAIRSISNWLYWQTPSSGGSADNSHQYLIKTDRRSTEPDIDKIRNAVETRKKLAKEKASTKNYINHSDYWIPSAHALPAASTNNSAYSQTISEASFPAKEKRQTNEKNDNFTDMNQRNPIFFVVPLSIATIAVLVVRLRGEETVSLLEEHIGGSLALQIVNSSWLPAILTGITWYVIGVLAVGFIESIRSQDS